ncbi:MAG TPA: hypothetical protein VD865_09780 [Stenotrophomonas sp.]|nr:hypothetical protein [Stenotrophomonas sp.]
MLAHHDVAFSNLIDRVARYGAATCAWDELYAWFGTDDIDAAVWRAVHARFREICAHYGFEDVPELSVYRFDAFFTLVREGADDEGVAVIGADGELEEEEDESEDEES